MNGLIETALLEIEQCEEAIATSHFCKSLHEQEEDLINKRGKR